MTSTQKRAEHFSGCLIQQQYSAKCVCGADELNEYIKKLEAFVAACRQFPLKDENVKFALAVFDELGK